MLATIAAQAWMAQPFEFIQVTINSLGIGWQGSWRWLGVRRGNGFALMMARPGWFAIGPGSSPATGQQQGTSADF